VLRETQAVHLLLTRSRLQAVEVVGVLLLLRVRTDHLAVVRQAVAQEALAALAVMVEVHMRALLGHSGALVVAVALEKTERMDLFRLAETAETVYRPTSQDHPFTTAEVVAVAVKV